MKLDARRSGWMLGDEYRVIRLEIEESEDKVAIK
jgi:hypothetical protein|tara:strand:- start:307 stop:408 length:102 start_codon:yes stop_codon:yes gene_type:complete